MPPRILDQLGIIAYHGDGSNPGLSPTCVNAYTQKGLRPRERIMSSLADITITLDCGDFMLAGFFLFGAVMFWWKTNEYDDRS